MRFVTLLSVWAFTICFSEAYADVQEFKLLTVNGAYEIETHKILEGAMQLNYRVNLAYPTMAISKDQYKQLGAHGWNECTGTKATWDSYPDMADENNPICVHELGKYLIKGNNLMLISLRYQSKLAGGLRCPSAPDSSVQTVIVVIYKHDKPEDMGLKRLGLSCKTR